MSFDCPSRLYKYLKPDRIDVLSRLRLRYTPLGAFNDPFEGRPEITGIGTSEDALAAIDRAIPQEVERVYKSLPPEKQAEIPFEKVLLLAQRMAQEKQEEILHALQSATPLAEKFLVKAMDEHLGALSLSEVPDSLLMWSHYAASHAGFVLEFDSRHPYFHEQRTSNDDFRHLRRVLYRDTRPSLLLTSMSAVELFQIKSSHWAYEREWRIIRALSEAAEVRPAQPWPIHLFSYPPDALTGVIIGARASRDLSDSILQAVKSNNHLSSVRIRRAQPDSTHFHLRIVDIDS